MRALALVGLAIVTGCTSASGVAENEEPTGGPCDAPDRFRLVRSESHPGDRRLHVQLLDAEGAA